uniref:mitochondrial inner membrane protease subunit 1-like isoform X1 n=2 Tax=Styela clava TaxID=7725 RepID=UPI001939F9CC|nr:mitochondrial inner membrane protease subunit 1-like isoform X1 [Styela clava]
MKFEISMALWTKFAGYVLKGAGIGIVISAINDSLVSFVVFQGESMNPTIQNNEIGLCDKTTPYEDIRRGDIVVAASPKQLNVQICKRVIALEGDEVTFQPDGDGGYEDLAKLKNYKYIPRGHVWLEGDNKASSLDSRNFGPVPLGLVRSRVIGKFYPFRSATIFAREPPNDPWDRNPTR